MHKISVPIMASTVTEQNRERYAELCREAGAERVFLALSSIFEPVDETLKWKIDFFKSCGYEVGVWTDTIGHGKALDHVTAEDVLPFKQMIDITGEEKNHACCPMDESFRAYVAKRVALLGASGAEIVMLDDDFRMSQHGWELCCACPDHLERIGEILGESISREELYPYLHTGKKNKYRDAWVQAQREGMVTFAREIRAEVDRVCPHVTVCMCTASTPWNVDGMFVTEVTRIFAGENQPIIRLTGAPYWAYSRTSCFSLITVFEIARMLASFVSGEGYDIMSEGDVYPRPRYTCPSSYLELYDGVTRADGGYGGILKYMFDYVAGPELELGYLKRHRINMPYLEALSAIFEGGANAGVRIFACPNTYVDSDLDLATLSDLSPIPTDGTMLGGLGIPTTYSGDGICVSVFGDAARELDLSLLDRGVMLDAVSAAILAERGVDVGIKTLRGVSQKKISFIHNGDGENTCFIANGTARCIDGELADGARTLIYSKAGGESSPLAYAYENDCGQRFLVFLFEGASTCSRQKIGMSGLFKNTVTQKMLIKALPWVAKKPLPAYCEGNNDLYLMCKKSDRSMSVALFNCFADSVLDAEIVLDGSYSEIELFGCEGRLDGDRVVLTRPLGAFCSAAFRVTDKKER